MTTKTKNSMGPMMAKRAAAAAVVNEERVRRGAGEFTTVTIRMSRDNWMTLKTFAMHEGETMQTVIMNGLNLALAAKGLKPMKEQK